MTDSKIEFGTALRSPYEVARLARQIENLGFDIVGCGEHVSFYGDSANGFVSLSVAAGATERVRLMSTITLVPLYPPALLAKADDPAPRSPDPCPLGGRSWRCGAVRQDQRAL